MAENKQVIIGLEADERYPDYNIVAPEAHAAQAVTVTPETLERWKRVIEEYDEVNDEMDRAWRESFEQDRKSRRG